MINLSELYDYHLTTKPLVIENIETLYGANYFSGGPIVRFRVNLGQFDEVFSNEIEGFFEKLQAMLPSLQEHFCSVGKPGGFFIRVKNGTLLGHIMEHVAIELQNLAGMDVGFGKTRMTKTQGVYNVVFRYVDEMAGIYAGKAAFNLLNSILTNQPFDIVQVITNLVFIREKRLLGPSTQAIVNEAERRGIPYMRIDKYNQVQLGTGVYRRIIRATVTEQTSLIGAETVDNKYRTTSLLEEFGLPVPKRIITKNVDDAISFFAKLKKPLVIKPSVDDQKRNMSIEIKTEENIRKAFSWAADIDKDVIVQEYIPGNTYRILIIDFKFVAAVHLKAPYIIGDGKRSVKELVDILNSNPMREFGDKGALTKVEIDKNTQNIIEIEGFTLDSIIDIGHKLYLKNSGSMRLGGASLDVTDLVHPYNKFVAERISNLLCLNVAGIDFITDDISKPINETSGKIIEVSAAPDFRMHFNPTEGTKRYVQRQFVDMLFPNNQPSKIPIYSVTGSGGKLLTCMLIENCLRARGIRTGMVNRNGLFYSGNCLTNKDMTNSSSVQIPLKDPTVECAILETTVESILESGLGYEYADFGIVISLTESKMEYYKYDHIFDIDDVSYAKSVVSEQVNEEGFAVLNADDDAVYAMKERVVTKLAIFSQSPLNTRIKEHVNKKGIAAVLDGTKVSVIDKVRQAEVVDLNEIPFVNKLTFKYKFESVLAATLALYLSDIPVEEIREAFMNFEFK